MTTQLAGRFAPSPTGPLHMGSLVTALASYLDIKQRGGQWLVRVDDIDPPRQDSDASRKILRSLQAHGLQWDQSIIYQNNHANQYKQALTTLEPHLFYCRCTRKSLKEVKLYPGTCREFTTARSDSATRCKVEDATILFEDEVLGVQKINLVKEVGDFIVHRRDNLWAYHLATAVDDGQPNITHVLRGQDLLDTTSPQTYLMNLLDLSPPTYAHLPVLCFADGTKLSKQTHAPALEDAQASQNLSAALHYLGMQPGEHKQWNPAHWIAWGLQHWCLSKVPGKLSVFSAASP
ncbi:MAG: tRNA glutamyl-Q(34) synthetase GluQRS [Gammaproteobacteria bacterium]|nr:tRNA glutamyl-Q(34) synthetase GluQRS [Gammaproteobacteria bacterium]